MKNLKYAICCLAHLPMRQEPSYNSEMVSEILFGEFCVCIEQEKKDWFYISNDFDNYRGWVNIKGDAFVFIDENLYYEKKKRIFLSTAYWTQIKDDKGLVHWLSKGSTFPNYTDPLHFQLGNRQFLYESHPLEKCIENKDIDSKNFLKSLAFSYLNVPYRWGGRSLFGIDCSGFIQQIFRQVNVCLPRDAAQQAKSLKSSVEIERVQFGDLLFFKNAKRNIDHVALALDSKQVIHASGKVCINEWNKEGIFKNDMKTYSHYLDSIKRPIY